MSVFNAKEIRGLPNPLDFHPSQINLMVCPTCMQTLVTHRPDKRLVTSASARPRPNAQKVRTTILVPPAAKLLASEAAINAAFSPSCIT